MTKTEEFTLSLTSDELNWLFEELFPEALMNGLDLLGGVSGWGLDAINIRDQWEAQVKAQGYGAEPSDYRKARGVVNRKIDEMPEDTIRRLRDA